MTIPPPADPVSQPDLIKASLLAGVIGLSLALVLKFTLRSPGLAMGLSMATFLIAQAYFIQRATGRRSSGDWARVLLLALGAGVASGIIMEL